MPTDLSTILKLSIPIIVQIGEIDLPMQTILALAPGAIIELEKSADEELDVMANDRLIGKGVAVKVAENFGIRVTSIGSPQQRVEALASEQ